jgi:beta-glucosidase
VIVVLEASGPITDESMPWMNDVEAIVMAWYPGMEGGNALAELLFGDANFSGRVPMTWPKRWDDEPAFDNDAETQMGYYHGYRHFDVKAIDPLFPFGFGLSYTNFAYANLRVPCAAATHGSVVDVQVDVTNVGQRQGSELVLLFSGYPNTRAARRPIKELKAFQRVALEPGETKTVSLSLHIKDLAYYDMGAKDWIIEDVAHDLFVGPNARDLPLKTSVLVQ